MSRNVPVKDNLSATFALRSGVVAIDDDLRRCAGVLAAFAAHLPSWSSRFGQKKKKNKALLTWYFGDEKIASFFLRILLGKMMHTPKPRVFGAAVLDVISVRRRGEEDASNSGDTSSGAAPLVVEPAFVCSK